MLLLPSGRRGLKQPLGAYRRLERFGNLVRFSLEAGRTLFTTPPDFREWCRQGFALGNGSAGLVALTSFIVGIVLTIQSRPTLARALVS